MVVAATNGLCDDEERSKIASKNTIEQDNVRQTLNPFLWSHADELQRATRPTSRDGVRNFRQLHGVFVASLRRNSRLFLERVCRDLRIQKGTGRDERTDAKIAKQEVRSRKVAAPDVTSRNKNERK